VTTEVQLSGKVATMGQGVLQDVSGRLVDTFAKNLAAMLEGGGRPGTPGLDTAAPEAMPAASTPAAGAAQDARREPAVRAESEEALDLGSLGGAVLAERLKDPRTLAGLLALVAAVFYLLWRRSA
jgi:hypothetical protein